MRKSFYCTAPLDGFASKGAIANVLYSYIIMWTCGLHRPVGGTRPDRPRPRRRSEIDDWLVGAYSQTVQGTLFGDNSGTYFDASLIMDRQKMQ